MVLALGPEEAPLQPLWDSDAAGGGMGGLAAVRGTETFSPPRSLVQPVGIRRVNLSIYAVLLHQCSFLRIPSGD